MKQRGRRTSTPPKALDAGSCPEVAANLLVLDDAPRVSVGAGAEGRYGMCPVATLSVNPHRVQTHSRAQIAKVARSMEVAGTLTPLIVDEHYVLLAGHARLEAARLRGDTSVPVVQVFNLSEAQKRTFLLADNRIGKDAGLDREALAAQLPELTLLFEQDGFSIEATGFEVAELDELVLDFADDAADPSDEIAATHRAEPIVLRSGDFLQLGEHRLLVGDARDGQAIDRLMGGERAEAAFLDPPYNVRVDSIGGRGKVKHPEFACASGEMTQEEFIAFLVTVLGHAAAVSKLGAIHFVCQDWKHVRELIEAGTQVYGAYLNLVVWAKTNAGQGGLYRNQHELIGVFRAGEARHRDNVQMGRFGRNRSNVWTYPGANSFRTGRDADLAVHPTVKPVRLVADALKDVTTRGGLVLDTFVGSGTTILAGEKIGRRVRAMEIEPRYAQVAARRWEAMTGQDAIELGTGLTLTELAAGQRPASDDGVVSTVLPRKRNRPDIQETVKESE